MHRACAPSNQKRAIVLQSINIVCKGPLSPGCLARHVVPATHSTCSRQGAKPHRQLAGTPTTMHHADQQQVARGSPCESRLSGAQVHATSAQHLRPTLCLSSASLPSATTRTNAKQQSHTGPSESRPPGTQHADTTAPLMAPQRPRETREDAKTTRDEPTSSLTPRQGCGSPTRLSKRVRHCVHP